MDPLHIASVCDVVPSSEDRRLPQETLGQICCDLIRPFSPAVLHAGHAFVLLACLLLAFLDGALVFLRMFFSDEPTPTSPIEWMRDTISNTDHTAATPNGTSLPVCPTHSAFLVWQSCLSLLVLFGSFAHLLGRWTGVFDTPAVGRGGGGGASGSASAGASVARGATVRRGLIDVESDDEEEEDEEEAWTSALDADDDEDAAGSSSSAAKKDVARNPRLRVLVYACVVGLLAYSSAWLSLLTPSLIRRSAACTSDIPTSVLRLFYQAHAFNLVVLALPILATVVVVVAKIRT